MKFYQLFKIIDDTSLDLSEEEHSIIVETFLSSDEVLDRVLDFEDEGIRKRKKRGKNEYTAHDRVMSLFSQKYLHHSNEEEKIDEYSRFGKKFRLRFRVPFVLFEAIVKDIRPRYGIGPSDCKGRDAVTLELLVLGSLRFIATGCSFDTIEELTNVSDEKHRTFFRDYFSHWGVHAAKSIVKIPKTEDELRHVMGLYERHAHPGCIGSIDCVHLAWDRCRSGMQALCTGKEKVPTLVFEVACTHTKRILSCSQWFFGTYNDKTISKYDPVIKYLNSDACKEIQWTALDEDENGKVVERKEKGAYFLCDGGYHLWDTLIPPYKDQLEGSCMMEWSKHVESSRKDIECVFGILKRRFLFLKHPIRFQSPEIIHRTFLTCCVLHNLLLDFDGLDNWEYQIDDNEEDANAAYGTLETLAFLKEKTVEK